MKLWIIACVAVAMMLGGSASAGFVAPNEACIYEHVDFVGASRCFRVEPGMRHKLVPTLGSFNDKASSLHVGEGVIVLLFAHANYGSGTSIYEKSLASLDSFSDEVSSLIIRPKAVGEDWRRAIVSGGGFGVELREKSVGKQELWFYPLPERLNEPEARYPVLGKMNDKANIAWLKGDIEVTFYEHANFAGKPLKLPGADYMSAFGQSFDLLKYQFGRRASSLVVRTRVPQQQIMPGQIKLPPPPPPREGSDAGSGAKPHRAPPAITPHEVKVFTADKKDIDTGPAMKPKTGAIIPSKPRFELSDTDRPGNNYRNFDLPHPDPDLCLEACQKESRCKAFTYVKPGVQGRSARCWLKDAVPPEKPSDCCISGVKR